MESLPFSSTITISNHHTKPTHHFKVCCNTKPDHEHPKFDRRNLLIGMGSGIYSASSLVSPVLASPISSPDLSKCSRGTNLNTQQPLDINCCPPPSPQIIDYRLPPVDKMRFRPAAHLATNEYIAKYERAIALMKALPDDDPRSFMQQANVHCAYCNLTYDQSDDDEQTKLQIHNSWLFYPWHRWYLYFYERILGKLIDDNTFGLPFWNWDNPEGMMMPNMFDKKGSPLLNERRNQSHRPPFQLDLSYSPSATSPTEPNKIVPNNLTEMYGEMVRNVTKLEDFYGAKYIIGTAPDPGPGSVERGSHTALHVWTGDPRSPALEDMGNFYSTGRDPIFFCHHANVDRLWSVWRGLRGTKPKDFTERDWLDANFVFYDENAQLVRVYVRDTMENERMGYTYQKVDLPWLNKRPTARVKKSKIAATTKADDTQTTFPFTLNGVVRVLVDRPKKRRSKNEKEEEEELLVIEGIEVDTAKFVRFEVYVNDEDDKPGEIIDKAEYAGSYAQVPHKNSTRVKSKIRLGLTELLEDLDVEDDDKILVSLVPKDGGEDITIGGIKIVYVA